MTKPIFKKGDFFLAFADAFIDALWNKQKFSNSIFTNLFRFDIIIPI